jgi:hypothetical protein
MADFRGTILTQRGRNLLAKAQTGAQLMFTRIKLGDGLWDTSTDPTQLNDLVSPKLNLPIQNITVVGDGTVRLRFVLTNTGLSQGFFMREIGIYAQDPDLGEILYALAYAGDRADFIPADGVTKVENVVDIYTVIANTQNVTAVISDTVVLASKQDIDNLAQSLNNLSSQVNSQITSQINNLTQQLNNTASTLSNQISTIKPEASSTAPTLVYTGKLWVDANNFLKYYNGSNWQNIKASFADTVDGFHASLTPAPNVIVPLNASGVLDLSATYVKSNVYTFRRVDLTNATSDYMLQVGEEAVIRFDNQQLIPLRVAVEQPSTSLNPVIYNINICVYLSSANNVDLDFFPNNTAYSGQIQWFEYHHSDGGWVATSGTVDRFYIDFYGGIDNFPCFANLFALYYGAQQPKLLYVIGFSYFSIILYTGMWNNTTTAWTSLGSFRFYSGSIRNVSGIALVRRLA